MPDHEITQFWAAKPLAWPMELGPPTAPNSKVACTLVFYGRPGAAQGPYQDLRCVVSGRSTVGSNIGAIAAVSYFEHFQRVGPYLEGWRVTLEQAVSEICPAMPAFGTQTNFYEFTIPVSSTVVIRGDVAMEWLPDYDPPLLAMGHVQTALSRQGKLPDPEWEY